MASTSTPPLFYSYDYEKVTNFLENLTLWIASYRISTDKLKCEMLEACLRGEAAEYYRSNLRALAA